MNTDILQQLPLFSNEPETIGIPLRNGGIAIVSAVDADIAEYTWYARNPTNRLHKTIAMSARKRPNASIAMHRLVLERILGRSLERLEYVDHINGDTLLNTRENLRIATPMQNTHNQVKRVNNTSGYKGVYPHKQTGKWGAAIGYQGKTKYIGLFDTPELAYAAYCAKAKEIHGEYFNPG